ncbi:MAG: TMEM165/GDT1 family protein [Anaerolineae bacterium]|nr:TMEM165/GDT1 family protein [Anaerolineae bacterium]
MDWKVAAATFALLFVAELGDKTQLAVISMTSKHQKPLAVFLGATAALATVTLLGVLGGQVLGRLVPAAILQKVAAAAFVILGILMWFGVL